MDFFLGGGAGIDTLIIVELTWWILWSFVYNFIVKALSLFSIHRSRKTHPGPVISLTDCPIDPNKVSIYTSINRLQPENWISKIYWNWLLYRKAVGQFRESYIWENQFINQMGCPKSVKVDKNAWFSHDLLSIGCCVMCVRFKFLVLNTIHKLWPPPLETWFLWILCA